MIVSALLSQRFRYATAPAAITTLIELALSGRHWPNRSLFYLSDQRCSSPDEDGHGGHYPGHQLGVGTTRDGHHAALHYCARTPREVVAQSLSAPPLPDAPEIIYDAEAQEFFPTNAVLPRDLAHAAIAEYLRTGAQPTVITWQPAHIL
ncbi:Imm1 family immunity protein [Allokutzneria sp. NRRL B-24872]|uniref:Imm1 family immunity protein n=1 Tax=Allokutzneria sp. NRRL B-24872 TaxID=1137961 RepID=UPI00143D13D0|nr:Imm1 family immunity protein [Allokutzneria sp. NRRL B-24872]